MFTVLADRDTDKLTDGYGGRFWFITSDRYGWRPQFMISVPLDRLSKETVAKPVDTSIMLAACLFHCCCRRDG